MKNKIIYITLFLALFSSQAKSQDPVANFIIDGNYCIGDTVWFYNQSLNYTGTHWFFGDGFDSRDLDTVFHIYQTSGLFNVTLEVFNNVSVSNSITKDVTIFPNPSVNISYSGDTTFFEPEKIILTAEGSGFSGVQWFNADDELVGSGTTIEIGRSGIYTLIVVDGNGCQNTVNSATITVKSTLFDPDEYNINVANNILTPDKIDGINDVLYIQDLVKYTNPVEIFIYNVWGDLVFSNSDYQNDWKGISSNGKPLDAGTYYYVVKSKERKGKTGFIDIIK